MSPIGLNPIQIVQVKEDKKVSLDFLLDSVDRIAIWQILMPKYHPVAIFKALILKEMRQISSKRKLAAFLKRNPYWLRKCGFKEPPDHSTFTRFINRVGAESLESIFDYLVREIGEMKT